MLERESSRERESDEEMGRWTEGSREKENDPHPHPKRLHSGGNLLPDPPESDDAQYLSIQLRAHELQNC